MTAEQLTETSEVSGSRSVVDRAFAIIGTFRGGRVRQSLSELSRNSGVPVATCHRIVGRLSDWGALERDAEGKYRIGLRLWEVASLAPRSMGLQRIARPYMQVLYEITRCNVQLAIREGHELISVERFESPRKGLPRPRVGGRYGLHATAIGMVLLAYAPEQVQAEVVGGELRRYTQYTYVDAAELARALEEVRRTGYAISDRQVDLEHVGVAAPVLAPEGTAVAALSLVFACGDADEKNMLHHARVTANGISRALRESGQTNPMV